MNTTKENKERSVKHSLMRYLLAYLRKGVVAISLCLAVGNASSVFAQAGFAVLAAGMLLVLGAVAEGVLPVTVDEAGQWLNGVIPLPKEVSLAQQVTLSACDVTLTLRADAGDLERNALRKLQTLFLDKAGAEGVAAGKFEILLGVCDASGRVGDVTVPDAARLQTLPNREQAYLIRPIGTDRLVLTALDARGVFYAALTLRQLLETRFRGDRVSVPLAVITDWPDLAERGEWGGSSKRDIEWMAERKMNLVEFHTPHDVASNGTVTTGMDSALLRRGRLNAVKMVPIISHLNFKGNSGAYAAFPDLRGKGEKAIWRESKGPQEVENAVLSATLCAPCASNPKLYEILSGWMRGYAGHEGVRDISCWLGELSLHCECKECAKSNQFALEARAFIKAWRLAIKEYPDLRIRILLTQGSYTSNDKVLAEIPLGVGVTYYDGGRTYDSSPKPMIYPLLEEYAAKGHWLGVYPQLTPSYRIVSPWSCPQFVKLRMMEFVDKKLTCVVGYVVPDNRLFDFNMTAAAEWSWNAHGRSERQFALAWATRRGFSQPEKVADWVMMLGPVAWDLYGARFVERHLFRPATIGIMISSRTKPVFGKGLFTAFPDEARMRANRQVCVDALRLANQAGSPAMLAETRVILGYYDMLIEIYGISDMLSAKGAVGMSERCVLQDGMNRLTLAGTLNIEALRDWERAVQVGAGGGRFDECIEASVGTIQAVAAALKPFGVYNSAHLFLSSTIGAWESVDFQDTAAIVKEYDVTESVVMPGSYTVTFRYTDGWNGLQISRVALVSSPKDKSAEQIELSFDEHAGIAAHLNTGNVYCLRLNQVDPGNSYRIVVKIRGVRPQDQQAGKTGCSGNVLFQRKHELDWQVNVLNVKPLPKTQGH